MFEAAELGRKVSGEEFKKQVPALRDELLEVQRALSAERRWPVIVLFGGVDGAGKSESVNLLNEWMDPRWVQTRAYGAPSEEERERPEYWRFWRDLPPRGRIGFFLSAWYSRPLVERVNRRIKRPEFGQRLEEIIDFERALTDDGALIIKFWMHLDKRGQKARLRKLEKDPLTRWRVITRAMAELSLVRALHRSRRGDDQAHEPVERAVDDRRRCGRAVSQPDRRDDDPRRDPQAPPSRPT